MVDVLRWIAILLIPLVAAADDRWIEIRSGPFQVLSNAGDRPARDVLNQLEQLRYMVGQALGKEDLKTTWPVRVVVRKGGAAVTPALARDTWTGALASGAPIPPAWQRVCVRLLIESNAGRMPESIETGMETFYSTLQAVGTKVTLGNPPPADERSAGWARIHLLVTDPNYAGRLRVMLYNLQRGADLEPAVKNAFGKMPAEIDQQAAAAAASGNFATVTVGGRALSPLRDFTVKPVEGPLAAVAAADLLLLEDAGRARGAYQTLVTGAPAEAHEGLGLAALRDHRETEARKELQAATEAGSTSAHAWLEAARLDPDVTKARAALQKAAELNPNWAAPYVVLASLETDPSRKLQWFKSATTLDPRDAANWQQIAVLYQTHDKYPEAAKAWAAAEQASVNEAERERIREARRGIEEKRLEHEAAERKRQEEERERDLRRVKDAAMAEVRAAEDRANRAQQRANPSGKVEHMEIGEAVSGKVRGKLSQVDCLGRLARLVIQGDAGKPTRLLVRDPKSIVVLSGGALSLGCGAQRPARTVVIEYQPKADVKLGTAGEVVTVTYE